MIAPALPCPGRVRARHIGPRPFVAPIRAGVVVRLPVKRERIAARLGRGVFHAADPERSTDTTVATACGRQLPSAARIVVSEIDCKDCERALAKETR